MSEMLNKMKLETKYYKIEKLLKWEHRHEVDRMLAGGVSPQKVSEWCKDKGLSISKQKLYDYKDMLRRSASKKITIEQLLGLGETRRTPIILETLGMGEVQEIVKNELEVLDAMIQLGFNNIKKSPDVKMGDVLRAIELKDKITGGAHGGLTMYGIDQLRELEEKKFSAILEVVMKYLPEDKLEEIHEAIENAEREFYTEYAPEYLEDYDNEIERRQIEEMDAIIVSDDMN